MIAGVERIRPRHELLVQHVELAAPGVELEGGRHPLVFRLGPGQVAGRDERGAVGGRGQVDVSLGVGVVAPERQVDGAVRRDREARRVVGRGAAL